MASLYRQKNSPYWWIRYRGPNGKIKRESTGLRADQHEQSKQAEILKAQKSAWEMEQGFGVQGRKIGLHDDFDSWVVSWIEKKGGSQATLNYQMSGWRTLRAILEPMGIYYPKQVSYDSAEGICDGLLNGRRRTTAHRLFKFFRSIMNESVRRGHIPGNPVALYRFKGGQFREKSELTKEQEKIVWENLHGRNFWIKVSFVLGLYQGARILETRINLSQVDFKNKLITLNIKGGKKHTTFLHPQSEKVLLELKAMGMDEPKLPPKPSMSVLFSKFLHNVCSLPNHSHHCLRVTCITRMARAGVPISQAMRFVGHSSESIHRIYQKLQPNDLESAALAIGS
jgi:integrase